MVYVVGLDNQVYVQPFDAAGNTSGGYLYTTYGKVSKVVLG